MNGSNYLGFLIFYAAFYLSVAFFAVQASSDIATSFGVNQDITAPPSLAEIGDPTALDYLGFVINYVLYFFGLQGLTIFGIGAAYAILISVPLTIGFVYGVVSLVRGGS